MSKVDREIYPSRSLWGFFGHELKKWLACDGSFHSVMTLPSKLAQLKGRKPLQRHFRLPSFRPARYLNCYITRALSCPQSHSSDPNQPSSFIKATTPYSSSLIMSSSSLKSFNPLGNNPFTDHVKGAIPEPPPPSKYARGVPSAHVTLPYLQNPPSPPGTQPTPLVAPIPQYAPPQMVTARSTSSASSTSSSSSSVSSSKPIFTLFRPDGRATPELEDVLLKKKSTWSKK
ncbi:hypothetical protein BJY52DRAFT_1277138 [Lactarius psammicola]|nr:hypothetical protein BJY52DRAFT_1277138 [Lactarius psammicola]